LTVFSLRKRVLADARPAVRVAPFLLSAEVSVEKLESQENAQKHFELGCPLQTMISLF